MLILAKFSLGKLNLAGRIIKIRPAAMASRIEYQYRSGTVPVLYRYSSSNSAFPNFEFLCVHMSRARLGLKIQKISGQAIWLGYYSCIFSIYYSEAIY